MTANETLNTSVLVIGGGGAGCRAAIEAHDQGADVVMMVKGRLGNSGCTLNVGTTAAVGPWAAEGDSDDLSMRDLLAHGGFLGDQEMAKVLVEESMDRVREMEEWGIDFVRDEEGAIDIYRSAAHTHPRNFFFKPAATTKHDYGSPPGIAMMDVLVGQVRKRGIRVLDDVALVDLLTADGRVVGATALDYRKDEILAVKARSTVIATGTYSHIFAPTTVSEFETGDGQAAAYRAGAELIDMECPQFVSTSVSFPPGTRFLNAKGETFLENYGIEDTTAVTKEEMCHAIWSEVKSGRATERETIFLDMRDALKNEAVAARYLPIIERSLGEIGASYVPTGDVLDPRSAPVESSPRAHTTIGGIRTNEKCETSVPGLFAAGGVAGGVYGLARPEGYTSMITMVFGRIAGLYAAEGARDAGIPKMDSDGLRASVAKVAQLTSSSNGADSSEVKTRINKVMRNHGWVMKDEEGLKEGLDGIRRIAAEHASFKAKDGFGRMRALEAPNLLLNAELMLEGSILRQESRGAFFRYDYPDDDDVNWRRNIIYKKIDGALEMDTAPVELKYCGPGD